MTRATILLLGLAAALGGCADEQRYVGEGGLHAFALTPDTPPFISSEDGNVYAVETLIELPLAAPTEAELAALSDAAQLGTMPFPRMPWVEQGDLALEVDWALTNLSDEGVRVKVVIDGLNEFHEHAPLLDAETGEGLSQWERTIELGPYETYTRTVHERELDEVAIDLATIANGAPNPAQVVYFENQSGLDGRVDPYVPEVLPALVGLRLGIRAGAALPLVMEATVRVRAETGVLAADPSEAWALPPRERIPVPPPPEEPPAP